MFGLIRKKKLVSVLSDLTWSQDERKATDTNDLYWRWGNANAVNYICHQLGFENPAVAARRKEDKEEYSR